MHILTDLLYKINLLLYKDKSDYQTLKLVGFSLFFGWMLAFPFKGQVLIMLTNNTPIEGYSYNLMAVISHFLGLFFCGFFIKEQAIARKTMIVSTIVCILGSFVFFLPFSNLWYIGLLSASFFSGLFVASWGYFFKNFSKSRDRLKIAADVIIASNIIMMIINISSVNISPRFALAIAIICLCGSLILSLSLEVVAKSRDNILLDELHKETKTNLTPLVILSLFILIITINSGLMYQIVNPDFAHFERLVAYYWILPYIVAILIIRNISSKTNLSHILYVALAMVGLSYISFTVMDRSITSYFFINTLMLAGLGILDLFWWSILGSFFDYYNNPVKVWGIGLSMNVLGIMIGGIIANFIITNEQFKNISNIALLIVLLAMTILPILHSQLSNILKKHVFLVPYVYFQGEKEANNFIDLKEENQITDREMEIIELVLNGYTYKAIAKDLHISENTIKYHTKNIYQKLNINSKMELIKFFSEDKK